jgi:predicted dehydrogenase
MTVLVVGGGKMGMSHLAILSAMLGGDGVALCESSHLSRTVFKRLGVRVFRSLDDARSATRITAAVVATPTKSHFPLAAQLLDEGVPCFIEKPLTLDPRLSAQLVGLCAAKGVAAQVGLVGRFIATFLRLREVVHGHRLGEVKRYRARMLGNVVTGPERGWRTNYSLGGGCLNEYGPHLLDLCLSIFGDVLHVEQARYEQVHSTLADDRIFARFIHSGGAEGEVDLDWCDASRRKAAIAFDVEFEKGLVRADNVGIRVEVHPGADVTAADLDRLQEPLQSLPVGYYLRGDEYSLQLEIFLEKVMERRFRRAEVDPAIAATLEDGHAADSLIALIAQRSRLA